MTPRVEHGDCRDVLAALPADSLDSCITDPPYELVFMGRAWDRSGVAFDPDTWRAVLRVLKPGAHLLACGGTRTAHRMTCAIEDAGFEIRDTLCWLYGSGFPKSLDVSKAMDKAAGATRDVVGTRRADDIRGGNLNHRACNGDRATHTIDITAPATDAALQWQGWGTALKPAHEPIILARKPFRGTVAANVLRHGCGAINVDACRVATCDNRARMNHARTNGTSFIVQHKDRFIDPGGDGRWPANVCHDGSDEVMAAFAAFGESRSLSGGVTSRTGNGLAFGMSTAPRTGHSDTGTASRFFKECKWGEQELRHHLPMRAMRCGLST